MADIHSQNSVLECGELMLWAACLDVCCCRLIDCVHAEHGCQSAVLWLVCEWASVCCVCCYPCSANLHRRTDAAGAKGWTGSLLQSHHCLQTQGADNLQGYQHATSGQRSAVCCAHCLHTLSRWGCAVAIFAEARLIAEPQ